MKPNLPCWCHSGKKYKNCHSGRDSVKRNLSDEKKGQFLQEIQTKFEEKYSRKQCLADSLDNNCNGKIIKAHTITRSSSLALISENDSVLVFEANMHRIDQNNGQIRLIPKKIRSTSIFMGFCSYHDKELFKHIEDDVFTGTPKQCLLFAYRSYAKEIYNKYAIFNNPDTYSLAMSQASKQNKPFIFQYLSDFFYGTKLAIDDMKEYKPILDQILINENFEDVRAYILEFNTIQPLMASGSFLIQSDFNGNELQDLGLKESNLGNIHVNSFASGDKGYIVFTWLNSGHDICKKFIDSIEDINDNNISGALISLIFQHLENFSMSPIWFNNLNVSDQNIIKRLMQPTNNLNLSHRYFNTENWNLRNRTKVGF